MKPAKPKSSEPRRIFIFIFFVRGRNSDRDYTFLFMCVHLLTTSSFQRLCCGFHSLKLCESRGGRPGLSFQLSGSETVVVVVSFLFSPLQKVWVLIRLWKPQHSRWKEDVFNKCTHINKKGLSSVPGQKIYKKNLRLGSDDLGLVYVLRLLSNVGGHK